MNNKQIISEAVKVDYITNAIKNRFVVNIYYDGDDTVNAGYRDIEIHKYGLTKRGNEAISAWQRRGASDTPENMPGWRLFLVNNIRNWIVKKETFDEPRPGYNPNTKSDGLMVKVFMTVTDSNDDIPPQEPKDPENKKVVSIKKPEKEIEPETKEDDVDTTIDYQDEFDKLYEIRRNFKNIIR